jgi:L-ascorbate metabolism protein UlaG (beta-lactamase superfamily)
MEETASSIKFIGTGGAFETTYGNSSAIVTHRGKRLLLDCGHAVFPRLVALGLAAEIDGILITHLHDDHVGSLSSFLLYHQMVLQKGRIKLYVPSAGLQELLIGLLAFSIGDATARVDFRPIAELDGVGFIDTFGRHVAGMQTYAYYFQDDAQTIVYSGDNGDADFLVGEIQARDLLAPIIYHEVFFYFRIAAHAYYLDLMRLSAIYPIYGYHCDPDAAPSDCTLPLVARIPELNY